MEAHKRCSKQIDLMNMLGPIQGFSEELLKMLTNFSKT
jgi:hypothetical protein